MFNLEQAIADWRQKMLAAGIETPVPLEELELHLREEMERQVGKGVEAEKAFETAAQSVGEARELKAEFKKLPEKPRDKFNRVTNILWYVCFALFMGQWGYELLKTVDFKDAYSSGNFDFFDLLFGSGGNLFYFAFKKSLIPSNFGYEVSMKFGSI